MLAPPEGGADLATAGPRYLVPLDSLEALALLGTVEFGRIVFTQRALPAIRPVNHLIEDGEILIRTRLSAKVAGEVKAEDTVVAYEADDLDPVRRMGWSVVVTGYARTVTDPRRIARVEAALIPWVASPMDTVIAIRPEIVNGFRLADAQPRSAEATD